MEDNKKTKKLAARGNAQSAGVNGITTELN